jgi:hypothetical protein
VYTSRHIGVLSHTGMHSHSGGMSAPGMGHGAGQSFNALQGMENEAPQWGSVTPHSYFRFDIPYAPAATMEPIKPVDINHHHTRIRGDYSYAP